MLERGFQKIGFMAALNVQFEVHKIRVVNYQNVAFRVKRFGLFP
jgi:hypothetical protein